jgi:hypothetical protein
MRELTGLATKYIKTKELNAGDVCVSKGKFFDIKPGKFGDTLMFKEESNGQVVGIGASGQLKYLISNESMKLGDIVKITYKGMKALKDGKTAKDFKVELFEESDEVGEIASDDEGEEGLGF